MPYPHDGGYSASSLLIASQRPPAGSHLSAWLHGDSAIVREHLDNKCRPTGKRKPVHTRSVTAPVQQQRDGTHLHAPRPLRPRASTMSVIDPVQSWNPQSRARILSTSIHGAPRSRYNSTHPAFEATAVPPLASGALRDSVVREYTKNGHRRHRRHRTHRTTAWEKPSTKPQPKWFPNVQNSKIRQKSIGTLVSGTLLMLVLTTYLALALSSTVPTTTFHAVFIFFILLLTIIFSHCLIRLCMLAFRTQPRWRMLNSTRHANPNATAVTSNNKQFSSKPNLKSKGTRPFISLPIRIPTPRTPLTTRRPIRLVPPYDDEAEVGLEPPPAVPPMLQPPSAAPPSHTPIQSPLRAHPVTHSASSSPTSPSRTSPSERPLPNPPPPAYGRWRDSIRIQDPEHTDLQQLTRELAMAEVGWSRDHNQHHHHNHRQRQPHLWSRTRRHHRRTEHGHGSNRNESSEIDNSTAPPSYSDGIVVRSDVYVVDEGGRRPAVPRPVLAPAPLFTGRGS